MDRERGLKVVISGDAKSLNKAFAQVSRDADHVEGKLTGFSRRIGPAFQIAGAAAAGALAVGLKASVDAAIEAEKSMARLEAQLKANGTSYRAHAAEIDAVIQKTSQLAGLDDEDLQDAFTNIVRVTGDVDKGLRLVGLAADFARAKHIDVAKAGEIVAKVAGGNTGILSRYGITIKDGATATEALGALQQRFAGQAKAYGDTTAGAQDRFRVATENLQEAIGKRLLPVMTRITNAIASFVNGAQDGSGAGGRFAQSMGRVANDVGEAVRAIRDVFQVISPAVREMAAGVLKRFDALGQGIRGVAKIISGILHGDFGKAWDGVKDLFRAQVKQVVGILQTSTAPFRRAGKAIGDAVYQGISAGFKAVVGFMEDRLNDVIGVINSAINVFNKLPGPDISPIDRVGGGGGGGPSRSSVVQSIPNSRTPSTSTNLPHGANPTGRSNFIARAATVGGGMVTGGGAGGGGITAQAAGLEGQPCVLTYYAPSRGGINGRAGGGAAGVPLYDGSWACAAPPSYAFGTIIRFYYGGRSVDVPVLDRGSAIQGNHFDLLVGPARALGMLDEGRVNARFKVVGKQRQLSAASSGGGARTGTRARGNAPAVMRRPTSSYPLGTRGPVIGTPHAGTHTLGDWQSDNAVDIRVKRGTPVLAVEDGTIVKVVERSDGGGRFAGSQITLRGRSGNSYFYTHLSAVNVTVGEEVSAGEQIGASGVANGVPHLHFGQQRGDPRATLQRKVATLPGVAAGQRPKRKRKRLPNLLGRVVDSAPSPVFGDTGEFTANEPAVTPEPEPGPTRDDWFARALMFAEMSGDPQRILGELRNQEGYLRGDFQAALGTPDPRDDITTGQALQALLDQIKSLEDTVENSAERQLEATRQQLALKEEEVAQLKRERNVSQADLAALRRSFIDMISGELGGRISGGLATPSYAGVGARW